jgi:hypothetical protein
LDQGQTPLLLLLGPLLLQLLLLVRGLEQATPLAAYALI